MLLGNDNSMLDNAFVAWKEPRAVEIINGRGLHSSTFQPAQLEPALVIEATAGVHFVTQPEPLRDLKHTIWPPKKCSRQNEKWKSVAHKRCLR
jgi:hypothetical protein